MNRDDGPYRFQVRCYLADANLDVRQQARQDVRDALMRELRAIPRVSEQTPDTPETILLLHIDVDTHLSWQWVDRAVREVAIKLPHLRFKLYGPEEIDPSTAR